MSKTSFYDYIKSKIEDRLESSEGIEDIASYVNKDVQFVKEFIEANKEELVEEAAYELDYDDYVSEFLRNCVVDATRDVVEEKIN